MEELKGAMPILSLGGKKNRKKRKEDVRKRERDFALTDAL